MGPAGHPLRDTTFVIPSGVSVYIFFAHPIRYIGRIPVYRDSSPKRQDAFLGERANLQQIRIRGVTHCAHYTRDLEDQRRLPALVDVENHMT